MRWAWGLWAGLLIWGCPREEPGPTDRTIEKLKAEQQRLAQGGRPGGPPTARAAVLEKALASPVAAQVLPVLHSQVRRGDLLLEVRAAVSLQRVEGATASVATAERFLRVVLVATAATRQSLELGSAVLERGEENAAVARDAQFIGQGTPLTAITIEPGARQELVIFFEASPSMLAPGLKLILSPAESRVELPLE